MSAQPTLSDAGRAATEHDFVLAIGGVDVESDAVVDALYESGCDDATLSARDGRVYLSFGREASTLGEAIVSAIRDVTRAGVGAVVLRVDACALASQSDIARNIGRSRQLVHQYISGVRGPGGFPPPVATPDPAGGAPLWDWAEVAGWLRENAMIGETAYREARDVAVINGVLEMLRLRRLDPPLAEAVLRLAGDAGPTEGPATPDAVEPESSRKRGLVSGDQPG